MRTHFGDRQMSLLLRCAKCGSHSGFLIETQDRKTLEVKGSLGLDRIKKAVLVTCTYCNNRWDHVPMTLKDSSVEDSMARATEERARLVTK
jgi:DNA-directed RNA polymerase subunit RPC12/RpoP